jgi:hypothetical protein
MYKKSTQLMLLSCALLSAQTTIDLGRQSRNVDFSTSSSTKTFKIGYSLPATCSLGETYLRLDGPAGQNFYACLSDNVWILQGGAAVSAPAFDWSRVSTTQAQVSLGSFRFGNKVTNLSTTATLTLSGTPTGSLWIYAVQSGAVVIGHNLGAGNLALTGAGYNVNALASGFPVGSLPLHQCAVTSGVLPVSCDDLRTSLASLSVTAGNSGGLSVDCSSGSNCVADIVPAVVPMTTSANSFTGLNSFSHMKLPAGTSADPLQCASSSDAGKIWIQTNAATGRQLYICEGTTGWRMQGGPVNISTATNVGYTSSVPLGVALSAQTSVGSANQVRVALVPIANQVRIARLAASIAAAAPSGKARIGIYRTDGSLITQTSDLDTSSVAVRSGTITPVVLDPGFYYFAWSLDNTTANLAGAASTTLSGLFNHVSASPGQATCSQSLTASGLPSTCTLNPLADTAGFPVIAIAGFAQ